MSIAARFDAALAATAGQGPEDATLLPDRLARATAAVLPVDGAGLSLLDTAHRRVPLGASSPDAVVAERLQFTVGAGPCTQAERSGEPVFATEEELHRRWPVFARQLVARTPYRAVVGLPLQRSPAGSGAVDLFLVRSAEVARLAVFEVLAVGELVASALGEAAVFTTWTADRGPDWLHAPAAVRRAAVWEAVGRLGLELALDAPAALALLRGHAAAADRVVDDVAADLLAGRLAPGDLRPGGHAA